MSDNIVCQSDLLATCADLLGKELPKNAGEDSESVLPIFKGEKPMFCRKGIINHSVSGHFAYREGKWKLILASGSAGWTKPGNLAAKKAGAPKAQLYDLEADPEEKKNQALHQVMWKGVQMTIFI